MKPVIIIAIAFVLLIPITAFAQSSEESLSELTARLDAENLQKAQEFGSIEEPSPDILQQESFKKIDCPSGYTEKAVSGGGIICVNEATGEELGDSGMINLDNTVGYVIIGVIIFIIVILGIAKASSKKSEPDALPRRGWTEAEKEQVRIRQDGKCAKCQKPPPRWEYHHIDEDRSNNSLSNCEGLCPNCHSVETHEG